MTDQSTLDLATVTAEELEARFDAPEPLTVGLEEEVMLLDPSSLDLAPVAFEGIARLDGDPRFKPELPASQLEILTAPTADAETAIDSLAAARRDLAAAAPDLFRPACAGTHPFASPVGELTEVERSRRIREEYGEVARRQLVASLQVHVAVGGAARSLAVYNGLRPLLPEIAALAANAPFHDGRDTGMASVRPKIAETLPRQGLPPAIGTWEGFARELRWGAAAGVVTEPRMWWWELRPHPAFGTLEVRVPDAQTTMADTAGVVSFVQALAASLADRHDRGESPVAVAEWRIAENRWSAARHGLEGRMADLETGRLEPTRDRIRRRLESLAPVADRLGSAGILRHASDLAEENGTLRQRRVAEAEGARGLAAWLADRFLDGRGGRVSGED